MEPITSFKRSLEEIGFNMHRDTEERPLGTQILIESSDSESGTAVRNSLETRRLSLSSSSSTSDNGALLYLYF